MKFSAVATASVLFCGVASAFVQPSLLPRVKNGSSLSMVLEKPKQKKLQKIEVLKIDSDHLIHPLKEVRQIMYHRRNHQWRMLISTTRTS